MGRAVTGYGRMWIAAAGAACAVALAGCNGAEAGPTPSESAASSTTSTTTTPTGSTTTSSSPTGTATVTIPAAARLQTDAGATAFAKFFHETASDALVTNDPTAVKALSAPGCMGCGVIIRVIEDQKIAGEHPEEARFIFKSSNIQPRSGDDPYVVDVIGTDKAVAVVDGSGRTLRSVPAVPSWTRLTLAWANDGWRVQHFAAVKNG